MAGVYEPDWGTAYYRSNDPIKNLRIKVTLKRVSAVGLSEDTPQPSSSEGNLEETGVELKTLKAKKGRSRDYDECIIGWQEKLFAQREVDFYSNEENCNSPLDQKYHKDVTSLPARKRQRNLIFTYVDHDNFSHQKEGEQMMTDYGDAPSVLATNMAQVRCRRMAGRQLREKEQGSIPKTLIIDENPSEESKLKNHLEAPPIQVMYIMADLGSSDSDSVTQEQDEYILCTLKIDANGVLSVRPDFTSGKKPYSIETLRTREGFDYTIESISRDMSRQEHDKELKMYREMYARHNDFVHSCVGYEFELPTEKSLRYIVFGEVVSAQDFEKDNLYVQLFTDLPKDWSTERSQQVSWVTQCCTTKTEDESEVAYFCYPFHFELMYKQSLTSRNDGDTLLQFPRLMLEVGALDSWYRHYNEGYSYIQLPSKPGIHTEKAYCWRPVGNSITDNLRRFFTGGSADIEDPTYAAIPSTFDGSHLSKFGFKTQSTGSVTLCLNVVLQSRSFMESKANKHSLGSLLDSLGITAMQANITSVLESFKRARMKMMHAREAATQELLREVKPIDKAELLVD